MVTEIARPENLYRRDFRELQERGVASWWLKRLRETAMDAFEQLGFPSVKDEEWKYTNVAPITRTGFSSAGLSDAASDEPETKRLGGFGYHEAAESQLVFVNGKLRNDLSSLKALPDTVVAMDLAEAAAEGRFSEVIRDRLARGADYVSNGFTALNTAFIDGGAFLVIPKELKVETPISLLFITDAADANFATFPRVLILAEENSSGVLIEAYASTVDKRYFTNAVVEIELKEGARLEHYKVQRESVESFHIATTAVELGRQSNYGATAVTFGAQLSRHDIVVNMDHEGAECRIDGLYMVSTGQHADTHSVIDHRRPHCTSRQLYKGILDGKSRAVFNGKIFVRHDAQKTDAMQTNKNLLLSNDARVDTKPQLEILADDVKCAHGAAVGQIDEDELFYLKSRGLNPLLARNLLTYGFAEEVIAKIKVASLKAELDEAVLHRLNASIEV